MLRGVARRPTRSHPQPARRRFAHAHPVRLPLRQFRHRRLGRDEEPARRQGGQPCRDVPSRHHGAAGLHDQHRGLHGDEVRNAVRFVEGEMGKRFGDNTDPLLLSVRSGARASMPGMMDTILNLGLNDGTVEGLIARSGNARFAYDSYRRFVAMFGDVVLGLKPEGKDDIDPFEEILEEKKKGRGIHFDTDLTADDLKGLVKEFKGAIRKKTGRDFPDDPREQLWLSIGAVFKSWMNE